MLLILSHQNYTKYDTGNFKEIYYSPQRFVIQISDFICSLRIYMILILWSSKNLT